MNYCSSCGSVVEKKIPDGDQLPRFVCTVCEIIHYENPKIIVGCMPVWEDQILLCKRAIEPRYGYWTIPAGFMENGEIAEEGAIRETMEEAGAHVEILRLSSVYSIPHINQVYLMYLARLVSLDFDPGPESLEVDLFRPEEIPWAEIAFPAVHFALTKYLENRESPIPHLGAFGR